MCNAARWGKLMACSVPLLALRVFVEVCRLGSMKEAAESLHVTAGAVSHHVKSLENLLGVKLFLRKKGVLELTPVGSHLFEFTVSAFDAIDHHFALLLGKPTANSRPTLWESRQERLTVTTTDAFAAGWLIPRIGPFLTANPDIDLRIESTDEIINVRNETRVDLAIRHGLGSYEGLLCRLILAPQLIPVVSPNLLKDREIAKLEDLLCFPLLHDIDRAGWPLWFSAHGVTHNNALQGAAFEGDRLLVQAAVAGHGIALVEDLYAERALMAGTLVKAINLAIEKATGYYLVARPASLRKRSVRRFIDWVDILVAGQRACGAGMTFDSAALLGRREAATGPDRREFSVVDQKG